MVRALAVVGICAIGCSSDGGGGLSPSVYATELATAVCQRDVRCGLFADQASCLPFDLAPLDPELVDAIDAGKATFDPGAAQDCLDATAAIACDRTAMAARVPPDACERIALGSVAAGSACATRYECASGECEFPTVPACMQACCQGTCVDLEQVGSGQMCVETADCAAGLICAGGFTCEPLPAMGSACNQDADCAYGLGCGDGSCKPLPAIGEPCPDDVCADVGATCSDAGTCVMIGLPGAPCELQSDCSPYAMCDVSAGSCAPLPTVGEPCVTGCSDGSFCAYEDGSGSCTPLGSDGTPCLMNAQCATDYCTDTGCAPPPACL